VGIVGAKAAEAKPRLEIRRTTTIISGRDMGDVLRECKQHS
jgi:hypothetical protein